jgi:hypothetical protein
MKKLNTILLSSLLCTLLYAKEEENHAHEGNNNIKINYETLDFGNSKKKEDGKRYGIELDQEDKDQHIQLYYEKTKTNTTDIIPKDLDVKKYTLKYEYKLTQKERFSFLYANIDDNIMKETNGGNIYGIGYSKDGLGLTQYISDYPHFDVYQSDFKYSFKKSSLKTTLIGKYIHLKDKNSNNFSKNAKTDYFTAGVKFHSHYNGYHLGAGAYLGKRIFAIMKEGFKVQHHAMEFEESYILGIGHSIGENVIAHIRYGYHKAKEVPIDNDNVKVRNLSFDMIYKF